MSSGELQELAEDIKANGLREPLTLTPDGKLLDGRNRALACELAGVVPATVVYDGNPWLYSLSKNQHRRHMAVDQIALVAAELATRSAGGDGSNQHARATASNEEVASKELTNAQAAKTAGIPKTAVESGKVVLLRGTEQEKAAVRSGAAKARKTADAIRARQQSPRPAGKAPAPSADPIDVVAQELIAKCANEWLTVDRMEQIIRRAPSAIRDAIGALKRAGVVVEQRERDHRIEFWIVAPAPGKTESHESPEAEAAPPASEDLRDVRIAELERELRLKDAEIAWLLELHPDSRSAFGEFCASQRLN
jgi:hypothetical protein